MSKICVPTTLEREIKLRNLGLSVYYQTMLGLAAGVFAFVTSVLDIKGGKLTLF